MFYSNLLFILIVISSKIYNVESPLSVRKFVYQKDKSEHCRRRVMPSVFLGRHVMEANSQILHFSQLEVPYSCYVSIRTEFGSNIILVIQIAVDDNESICVKNESPIIVYEMGETYGGYWGPLPDSILKATRPADQQYYTQKKRPNKLGFTGNETPEEIETTTISTKETTTEEIDKDNYLVVEVPLVNITGDLHEIDENLERAVNLDDFDNPDVLPKPGVQYQHTMVPLLEFSLSKELKSRNKNNTNIVLGAASNDSTDDIRSMDSEQRYQLDFKFGDFTLDPRLNLEYLFKTPSHFGKKYPYDANKRLNFKKVKSRMFAADQKPYNDIKRKMVPSATFLNNTSSNNSWAFIEALLKNLTTDELEQLDKESSLESENFSALLRRIADWQHNYSAYLAPNLTSYIDQPFPPFIRYRGKNNTETNLSTDHQTTHSKNSSNYLQDSLSTASLRVTSINVTGTVTRTTIADNHRSETTNSSSKENDRATTETGYTTAKITDIKTTVSGATNSVIDKVSTLTVNVTSSLLNIGTTFVTNIAKILPNTLMNFTTEPSIVKPKNKSTESTPPSPKSLTISSLILTTPVTGSMINRESWGNIVNVAPEIADKLHHPSTKNPETETEKNKIKAGRKKKRIKRSIQAIPIDHARPHNLTTDSAVVTTADIMYHFANLHDFAQLVELQDDELHGHKALRYMRRYVGAKLFDFCEKSENRTRLVFLFNTSRIVVALNNFTLKRMTLVATPARTLSNSEPHCYPTLLECQVAGARVCIDSMTACDGVPNCGAYDIYDEDRLRCGAKSIQHNVYLAGFTFMAVLFTLFYTIHYWLKRCIPKVSEAFFVYTDGTENILYLESIMRSPLATDDTPKYNMGHPNYFEDALDFGAGHRNKKTNIFKKILFFCFWRKAKKPSNDFEMLQMDLRDFPRNKLFSFTEIELSKMTVPHTDVGVQTGDSLQMPNLRQAKRINNKRNRTRSDSIDPRKEISDLRVTPPLEPLLQNIKEDSELSVLKFFRDARSSSVKSSDAPRRTQQSQQVALDEMELKNTLYERSAFTPSSSSREHSSLIVFSSPRDTLAAIDTLNDIPNPKRLRFEESLPAVLSEVGEVAVEVHPEPQPEPSQGGSRRFWGQRGKNAKKKIQTQLLLNK